MATILYWFRQDLRISDNPSLFEAAKAGKILPIYILDDENAEQHKMGSASRVWLHHSLVSLNKSLNGNLRLFKGNPETILSDIAKTSNAKKIYWNRCYEPWQIKSDDSIKSKLQESGVEVETYNGSLLLEPQETLKSDGTAYKVFTPFYKRNYLKATPRKPLKEPQNIQFSDCKITSDSIESLKLLPKVGWDKSITEHWNISEDGAKERLHYFIDNGLKNYKQGTNFPAQDNNSRLSPYLHFGLISPHQIWYSLHFYETNSNIEHFCMELAWREFSYSLLYHFPSLPSKCLQSKFDHFPWQDNPSLLKKWQKGLTGYPIVDAGMRELWKTGFMHNRVRMIVGSFLVKNLLIHWQKGQEWFWDCLVDADLANNSAGWQWIAGCGADAAPYFRIFNPITQGQRFDEGGAYIKKYIPELKDLPDKYLSNPWEAPEEILKNANIELGVTYPLPIVDTKTSREAALTAYQKIK
jgi:deoxyribodipyrimidine photo-lyase